VKSIKIILKQSQSLVYSSSKFMLAVSLVRHWIHLPSLRYGHGIGNSLGVESPIYRYCHFFT